MKHVLTFLVLIMFAATGAALGQADKKTDPETGLIIDEGFETVKMNCTPCHSAMLITQNSGSREWWLERIRWMQEKQGLWEFAPDVEETILDYLAENYAPQNTGRRGALTDNPFVD